MPQTIQIIYYVFFPFKAKTSPTTDKSRFLAHSLFILPLFTRTILSNAFSFILMPERFHSFFFGIALINHFIELTSFKFRKFDIVQFVVRNFEMLSMVAVSLTVYLVLNFDELGNNIGYFGWCAFLRNLYTTIASPFLHLGVALSANVSLCIRSCYHFNLTSKLKFPCKHVIDALYALPAHFMNTIRLQRLIPIVCTVYIHDIQYFVRSFQCNQNLNWICANLLK